MTILTFGAQPKGTNLLQAPFQSPNTRIYHETDFQYGAPHHFTVTKALAEGDRFRRVGRIDFQEGPIGQVGLNGVSNEDVIAMVIRRLEGFQSQSKAPSQETAMALLKMQEAMMWLHARTLNRQQRGVEGQYRA